MAVAVNIEKLTKSFPAGGGDGEFIALQDVSFQVEENEFLCILGPSGCGKSTILNILSSLDSPSSGGASILTAGNRKPTVGYVFQESRLLPWRTVQDNVGFALESLGISAGEKSRRIAESLAHVGLTDFAKSYPYQLSGGMQARVSIARALSIDPDILLLDEPFSSLDEITARGMRKLLLDLWQRKKKTIMFVTHNIFEATFLADRILVMTPRPGRIYKTINTELPRPRDYEDPEVFRVSSAIAKDFLREIHVDE